MAIKIEKRRFEDLCIIDGGYRNVKYGVRSLVELEKAPKIVVRFYFEEGTTDEHILNMKVALRKMNKKTFRIQFNANIDNSKELFKYLLTFKIVIEYLDKNDDIEKVFCFPFINSFEKVRDLYHVKINKDFYKNIIKYFNIEEII
ncbi:MAG TPA: hypothetical protein VIK86_07505 [Candidatus Paceibacterota bacterium]